MAQQEPRRGLPERVAGWYYSHGLFCSSHPIAVISVAITIVLLCCYPLLNLPLPGNVPHRLWTVGNSSHPGEWNASANQDSQLPRWFTGPPTVFVQQVVMRTTVAPWTEDLLMTDAFRAPLAQVFQLIEIIRNYQHENSSTTLSNVCLHVEAVKVRSDKKPSVLPEYNCLLLSPAGLWEQNGETFQDDSTILATIFGYQNLQKGKISLAEMLFGMNMKETGIKHYPLRTRQRVLQYAVTVILQHNDKNFLNGLRKKLTSLYPLHQVPSNETVDNTATLQTLHIYYPGQFHYREFLPLAITYSCLFLYVYFSVRKIELVKSKIGMAFSAMATVLASLSMSIGLCFFFGLTLSLNGKEIYPYIVVIVGLENVLVLTKSVVSTPMHLDVKIRVAQGLSREGWSITKNLLTEVTILTIGLFTFVPAIQEFCIFAVVGLLSDFFLQMLFFSTVLAIDIRRMELTSDYVRINSSNVSVDPRRRFRQPYTQVSNRTIPRSKSHPKLNGFASYPTNIIASYNNTPTSEKIPKRLRLVHFWARTRIFQRMFMISMVVWISVISYSSFPVEQLFPVASDSVLQSVEKTQNIGPMYDKLAAHIDMNKEFLSEDRIRDLHKLNPAQKEAFLNDIKRIHTLEQETKMKSTSAPEISGKLKVVSISPEDLGRLRHSGVDPWQRLSNYHWPAILSMYNMTLSGHYISLLPAIRLSHVVRPEQARAARNHREKHAQHFQWQALAAALDPLDFTEGSETGKSASSPTSSSQEAPFVPTSPMELFLTAVLCVVSVLVLAYTMVVLYGCVCTRNYAEWRTSWKDKDNTQETASQVVMEAVPLVLEGHPQDIECLTTDGALLVSSDLSGQLRVWDSLSGESLAIIDRKKYFSSLRKTAADCDQEDLPLSDYESGSPPSSSENLPAVPCRKKHGPLQNPDTLKLRRSTAKHSEHPECSENPVNSSFGQSNCRTRLNDREYNLVETSDSKNNSSNYDHAFWNLPDLSSAINTNFTSQVIRNKHDSVAKYEKVDDELVGSNHPNCLCGDQPASGGFDYGDKYRHIYREHCKYLSSDCDDMTLSTTAQGVENQHLTRNIRESSFNSQHYRNNSYDFNKRHANRLSDISNCTSFSDDNLSRSCNSLSGENVALSRSASGATEPCVSPDTRNVFSAVWGTSPSDARGTVLGLARDNHAPPIWCLDCCENLVAIGCANGRLEFWEGSTGTFKCLFEDGSGVGITHVRIIGNRVVAAKLSGCVDFLELESYSHGQPMDWGFTSHKRTHVRTGSAGSALDWDGMVARKGAVEDIRCIRLNTTRAHQQPITVLDSEGGRVLTGSQDHTLKVYRLEDQLPLYTLHGHCGPITCLFIDRISPMMSGSGSQDGLLCVWDLLTGACMYSIQAHSGSVSALTYSASYVISLGTDERLCVWERFQGHLLNTIQVTHTYCTSMVMLTHNLLITSKQGSLVVWDVRTGDPVRMVALGHTDSCVFVKQVLLLSDSIACDYGNQLRVVRFPLVADKCD